MLLTRGEPAPRVYTLVATTRERPLAEELNDCLSNPRPTSITIPAQHSTRGEVRLHLALDRAPDASRETR
jgi:hypothetical protein